MVTTGSKFFYGLTGVLFVAAVVYGYTTGGDEVGPLSLGYKGGVGDHVGYTVLMMAALLSFVQGVMVTAARDADPEAEAELVGMEQAPDVTAAPPSYWPIVGAFSMGLVIVGLALDSGFFIAGLIGLGAVAIEWTMQAWSERATGDPAANRAIRNRLMLPIEVPVAGALIIAVVVFGYSRVFLTVSKEAAVWIALGIAFAVFFIGAALSFQPTLRSDIVAGLLVVLAVGTIAAGIASALNGVREIEEHHGEEEEHEEETEEATEEGLAVLGVTEVYAS